MTAPSSTESTRDLMQNPNCQHGKLGHIAGIEQTSQWRTMINQLHVPSLHISARGNAAIAVTFVAGPRGFLAGLRGGASLV